MGKDSKWGDKTFNMSREKTKEIGRRTICAHFFHFIKDIVSDKGCKFDEEAFKKFIYTIKIDEGEKDADGAGTKNSSS